MYSLIDTNVVAKGISKRWHSLSTVALTSLTVKDALNLYRKFYIKLQAGSAPAFWADLHEIVAHESTNVQILTNWLSSQVQYNFTEIQEPIVNHKVANYSIASQAGYRANTWDRLYGTNNPEPTRKDLLLTREVPNTNYIDYNKYCLTSVAGLFHFTDVNMSGSQATGVIIENGMSTIRNSSIAPIGIWSFSKVSALKKYKIDTSMITKLTDDGSGNYDITKSLLLTLPQPAIGKYIMLVIAGHICFKETNTFSQYTDDKLLLNLNIEQAMIDRYYCANSLIDMSSVNSVINPTNLRYINKENIISEAGLKSILTLPQSFIVAFDNSDLYIQISEALRSSSRVLYTSPSKPNAPIMGLQGVCPEYWSTEEKHGYSLRLTSAKKYIIENNPNDIAAATYSEQLDIMPGKIDYDSYLYRQDKQFIQLVEMGSDKTATIV
jgi:hypothetical protein